MKKKNGVNRKRTYKLFGVVAVLISLGFLIYSLQPFFDPNTTYPARIGFYNDIVQVLMWLVLLVISMLYVIGVYPRERKAKVGKKQSVRTAAKTGPKSGAGRSASSRKASSSSYDDDSV